MIKKSDLIGVINDQGHDVKHATLSKWVRIVEQETGYTQGPLLQEEAATLILEVVNARRARQEQGEVITFREVLRERVRAYRQPDTPVAQSASPQSAEPVTVTLNGEEAEILREILTYARGHASGQQSVVADLAEMRRELEQLTTQMQRLSEQLTEASPPLFDSAERVVLLSGARQALALDHGFALMESQEGPVFVPRRSKTPPLAIPDPEPAWWRRSWDWVLDRVWVSRTS